MTLSKVKAFTSSLIIVGAAVFCTAANAFYPIATEPTQIISWAMQYRQMVQEYEQLVATYNSLNGARGLEKLVNDPASRKYLPADYANILQKGYGDWKSLRAALDAPVGYKKRGELLRDQLSIDEAMNLEAYRRASKRIEDIQVLLDKLRTSVNAKDTADLQARIQAEQAMISNERVKLSMLKDLQDIQSRKLDEMARRNAHESLTGKSSIYPSKE